MVFPSIPLLDSESPRKIGEDHPMSRKMGVQWKVEIFPTKNDGVSFRLGAVFRSISTDGTGWSSPSGGVAATWPQRAPHPPWLPSSAVATWPCRLRTIFTISLQEKKSIEMSLCSIMYIFELQILNVQNPLLNYFRSFPIVLWFSHIKPFIDNCPSMKSLSLENGVP